MFNVFVFWLYNYQVLFISLATCLYFISSNVFGTSLKIVHEFNNIFSSCYCLHCGISVACPLVSHVFYPLLWYLYCCCQNHQFDHHFHLAVKLFYILNCHSRNLIPYFHSFSFLTFIRKMYMIRYLTIFQEVFFITFVNFIREFCLPFFPTSPQKFSLF